MSDSEGAAAARAVEQARLRKERREAKIRAGGASRLDRISGLGGGVKKDPVSMPPATQVQEPIASSAATTAASTPGSQQGQQPMIPSAPPQQQQQQHGDPDEIDISQHFYQPQPTTRFPAAANNQQPPPSMDEQAQLRQMMLMGLNGPLGDSTADEVGNMGTVPPGMGGGSGQDPMMNLMMQFLGGGGAGVGGMPPFSAMGGQAQAQGGQQQQAMLPDRYDSLWRLLHTAMAFGLGLYIALWTTFSGSKLEREGAAAGAGAGRGSISGQANADQPGFQQFGDQQQQQAMMMPDGDMASVRERFFWAFATAEAVLLTTRFFLDRSRPQQGQGGILSTLTGFLPQPAKGRVQAVLRYKDVFTTVRRDVLVCVFVLGACSWLRA